MKDKEGKEKINIKEKMEECDVKGLREFIFDGKIDEITLNEEVKLMVDYLFCFDEYLPNLEEFSVKHFLKTEKTFINWYTILMFYSNEYLDYLEEELNKLNDVEKSVYTKVFLTLFEIYSKKIKKGSKSKGMRGDYIDEIALLNDFELKKTGIFENEKRLNRYFDYRSIIVNDRLIKYFTIQFNKFNKENLPLIIKENKNQLCDNGLSWYIEVNKNYKETSSKEVKAKPIKPIKMELNQSQIVYLFMQLVKNGYINENLNSTLWNLVSKYFYNRRNEM